MDSFLPTIILRHRKENLKKCSLRGLEGRKDMIFYTYPNDSPSSLEHYIMLDMSGPCLSKKDVSYGLFLVDGTWNYAKTMTKQVEKIHPLIKRSLPENLITAYPRKQTGCLNPSQGLSSIEALFTAYLILGRDSKDLLANYYWEKEFLKKNTAALKQFL